MIFRFGPYRLDARERLFFRADDRLNLAPKVFDSLLLLVRNAGRVVDKESFFETVWPGVTVTEASLKQTIATLRRSLPGDGESYIETVPKVGYRFTAAVETAEPSTGTPASAPSTAEWKPWRAGIAWLLAPILLAGALVVGFRLLSAHGTPAPAPVPHPRSDLRKLLLRGRHDWSTRSPEALFRSILEFQKATELDPTSAAAWSGLADACAFDSKRWPEAERMARRAIELDPTLSQPHATLAFLNMGWKWTRTLGELDVAVRLDPRNVTARQWRALSHVLFGSLSEAQLEIDQAVEIDPLYAPALCDRAEILYFRGERAAAREALRDLSEIAPGFINTDDLSYRLALSEGRLDEASAALQRFVSSGRSDRLWSSRQLEPRAFLEAALVDAGSLYYPQALLHAGLGRTGEAIDALEKAYRREEFLLPLALVEPILEPVRRDPRARRFLDLLTTSIEERAQAANVERAATRLLRASR